MTYWKLGCRWGKKSDGLPLFYDILVKNNIIIGWHTMDYQKNNLVLLTDGYQPLAIARTKTERKSIYELPHLEKEFEAKKVYYEDNLFYYEAEIIPIKSDFTYDYQKGIAQIHKPQIINKINQFYFNVKNKYAMIDKKKLLQYKKQIILQGPPGTGKTKEAKAIAKNIILDNINIDTISNYINVGDSLPNASGTTDYYKIKTIDLSKKEVILVSDKSKIKGNFAKFDKILERLKEVRENAVLTNTNGQHPYEIAVAKFIYLNVLKSNEQFKFVQFHPSYTYEDFVRGIVAKPNPEGEGIIYEVENKTLGGFAKNALENYKKSQNITINNNLETDFDRFINFIIEQLDLTGKFYISENVYIFSVEDNRFKYKGDNWIAHASGLNMNFSQLKKIIALDLNSRQEIVKNELLNSLTRQHATYYQNYVDLYKKFIKDNPSKIDKQDLKKFVLIIDEINRANLSSVLGELIYALEYRGEEVESMYEVDDSQKLIIPPNLYIIGTMNTADRSVGHIDYAIQRRFAFVDILPKNLTTELGNDFKKDVFTKVSELFIENYNPEMEYGPEESRLNRSQHLSEEFEPKDIWLGHSYFIQHYEQDVNGVKDVNKPVDFTLRLEYEIKPILREYVKDGILKQSALEIIENLGK